MDYKNILTFIGKKEDVESVMDSIHGKTEDGLEQMYIDFNNIIEVDEGLKITYGSESVLAWDLLFEESSRSNKRSRKEAWQELVTYPRKVINESILSALQMQENIQNTGHADSDSWKQENWGFTSNAVETKLEAPNVISFCTFDAPASKLIDALRMKFPKVEFKHVFEEIEEGLPFWLQ